MSDKKYHKNLIWSPKHDMIVRLVYHKVMGRPMHKAARVHKISKKHLIGTGQMTVDKEKKIKEFLGKRVKITDKVPLLWVDK